MQSINRETTDTNSCLTQFIDQMISVHLADSERSDKIEGKLVAVDKFGIVLSEGNEQRTNTRGVFFYPWEAVRYAHLSTNVDAFRRVA